MKCALSISIPLGLIAALALALPGCPASYDAPELTVQKHVVLVVMDGLRPDSVTPEDMPTLFALGKEGTVFAHNHPVYVSSTEVNGTALSTGFYPEHSGIVANKEFRPNVIPYEGMAMESEPAIRKADLISNGHYILVDTMAETLHGAGLRTAVAGTKAVAMLADRKPRPASATSVELSVGLTLPPKRLAGIVATLGKFPELADAGKNANGDQDAWTTRALTQCLWKNGLPSFSMLWLSEPDFAQHGTGPGSPISRLALKSSDSNLARVIAALKKRNWYDSTDIFVVSDHGFSTVARTVDVVLELHRGGFHATERLLENPPPDEIMVAGNGGSFSLYVPAHDPDLTARVVRYLQTSDFAGVIFTQKGLAGTFPLAEASIDSPEAPDILVSMRWTDELSRTGMPGLITSEGKKAPSQGNHSTLSKFDMHNTLIAEGPDIKKSFVDELPSGNIDVAPTLMSILDVPSPKPMDGRILGEALVNGADPGTPLVKRLQATATNGNITWNQYLQQSIVDGRVYLDEGNIGK